MKKVLITGTSGFIGRNTFDHFRNQDGYEVWGTYKTKKPFDDPHLIQADLTKKEDVERVCKGVDLLIHAAAVTSGAKDIVSRPYIHVTDNTLMNTLLLQSAYDYSIPRLIFFSCTVMYPMDKNHPLTEEDVDLKNGIHPKYFGAAWMKTYAENLCKFYAGLGRTRFSVLRHSNIYGPHDSFDPDKAHVCAATITKVMNAVDLITVWGDGTEGRDFLYIDDLLECIDLALLNQTTSFDLCNVGYGVSISVRELVETIIRLSGKELRVEFDTTKPTIPSALTLDLQRVKHSIGWEPRTNLESGILKTLAWYKDHVVDFSGSI